MTAEHYELEHGKTPEDVAYFLHDFFVAPLDWAIEQKGMLIQQYGKVFSVKLEDSNGNVCGMVGCMGAWVSHFFFGRSDSDYVNSAVMISDFFGPLGLSTKPLEPVWHNPYSARIFHPRDEAYNNDGTTTLSDVKRHFENAIDKLMEMK